MHALLERGVHSGDELGATLDTLSERFKGKDRVGFIEGFGALFHSHEAAAALSTLMQQREEFEALRTKLGGVDNAQVERDFLSGFQAPAVQMRILREEIEQLTERLGQGFVPVLSKVVDALGAMNSALKSASDNFPKTTGYVLAGFASLMALGAALGLIGAIWPLITTGAALLGSVFVALSSVVLTLLAGFAAFGAAAYDIYAHWDRFRGYFVEMWEGVKQAFNAFLPFVTDVFMVGLGRALHGDAFRQLDDGVVRVFVGLWDAVKQVFNDFVAWVDGWANGLASHIVHGIGNGFAALPGAVKDGLFGMLPGGIGASLEPLLDLAKQKTKPPAASNDNSAAAPVNGRVDVHVRADPGTAVTAAQGSGAVNVQAPVAAPARGATVGRP